MNNTTRVETMLFAYAAGVGSLTAVHLPLIGYGAAALLAVALALLGLGFWQLAKPSVKTDYLWSTLLLAAIVAVTALLYMLAAQMTDFEMLQLHNSVTAASEHRYSGILLMLFAAHAGASLLAVLAFFLLLQPQKINLVRFAALVWGTFPVLFLLMKLFTLLPSASQTDMMVLLAGWLAVTAAAAFATYVMTGGHLIYTAVSALLTLAAPPLGISASAIFIFVRSLMPDRASSKPEEGNTAEESPQYIRQLKTAQAALKQHQEALTAITSELKKINPESHGAKKKRNELEKKAAATEMKKITAEETLERLQKSRDTNRVR